MFLLIGILPLVVIGYISIGNSSEQGIEDATSKLSAVMEIKRNQLTEFFSTRLKDMQVLAGTTDVKDMNDLLCALRDMSELGASDTFPFDSEQCVSIYDQFSSYLNDYVQSYEYDDMYIVDSDFGFVMYSYAKASDIGENLKNGSLSTSGLGQLWNKIVATGQPTFQDFSEYGPADNKPCAFFGAPVIVDGSINAVVAIRISPNVINEIMLQRTGMGNTGETYLVAEDNKMRSDSYLDAANYSVEASISGRNSVGTEQVREALLGNPGTLMSENYKGTEVISAFSSITLPGEENWAILGEISLDEIQAPINDLRNTIIIVSLVIASLVGLIALWMALQITKPIGKAVWMMKELGMGHLSNRINSKGSDEIAEMTNTMDEFAANLQKYVVGALIQLAEGDTNVQDIQMDDKDEIGPNLGKTVGALRSLIEEGKMMADATKNGHLNVRGDVSKFEGGYRDIVEGFNNTIENIMNPVNEAVACMKEMAQGNLNVKMTGEYEGDNAVMKDALNTTLQSFNDILSRINNAVDQVSSGSQQVSDSSQSLSQGATEQASSLEEVSASITEIASQTKTNADNASQANQLATSSKENADDGNQQMKKMVEAMGDINKSSTEISKIIKVIDEIAFQTNLLALNAAVEAARAGVHGKGFAVVAEEVRNLAMRSAEAAKETTELIEGSTRNVENGTNIANETANALEKIVDGISKASDLVNEIAVASTEQAEGIEQVNTALGQIDQVTQSNTANAEESAAASEELSSQSTQLKQNLSRFRLSSDNMRMQNRNISSQSTNQSLQKSSETQSTPGQIPDKTISLDDDEFSEF